jgi:hypothetical protein
MKTIALSMLFSLAVIVCEQQTLFAPHYTDWAGKRTAVSKSSSQNSLVPIAGVDRLVPVAESFVTSNVDITINPSTLKNVKQTGDCSSALVPTPPVPGVSMYDHIRGGQEGEDIVDSYQFLPWHRG